MYGSPQGAIVHVIDFINSLLFRIIIADGSAHDYFDFSDVLMEALDLARRFLGCSFEALETEDLDEALLQTMGACSNGKAPHSFQFKVRSSETQCFPQYIYNEQAKLT